MNASATLEMLLGEMSMVVLVARLDRTNKFMGDAIKISIKVQKRGCSQNNLKYCCGRFVIQF